MKNLINIIIFSTILWNTYTFNMEITPILFSNISLEELSSINSNSNLSGLEVFFDNPSSSQTPLAVSMEISKNTQSQLVYFHSINSPTTFHQVFLPLSQKLILTQYLNTHFYITLNNFKCILGETGTAKTVQNCLSLFQHSIPEYPKLNMLIRNTACHLYVYLFDKAGKYRGAVRIEDISAIQTIINNFEKEGKVLLQEIPFDQWQMVNEMVPAKDILANEFNADIQRFLDFSYQGDTFNTNKILEKYRNIEANSKELYFSEFRESWFDALNLVEKMTEKQSCNELFKPSKPQISPVIQELSKSTKSEIPVSSEPLALVDATVLKDQTLLNIANDLSKIENSPLDVANYLAERVSLDHIDQHIQCAYPIFYTPEGIPKLISHLSVNLQKVGIPTTIGNALHEQDRVSLFKLSTMPILDTATGEVVHKGISYIVESCKEGECWQSYSNLARDVADAIYHKEYDRSILSTGDYSAYCKDIPLKNSVVPFVTEIADNLWLRSSLNPLQKDLYQRSLKIVDAFWQGLTKQKNIDCATSLKWILKDRDNALKRTQELALAAQEQKQAKIEDCFTIEAQDIVGITQDVLHIPTLAEMRKSFFQQFEMNPAGYVQGPKFEKKYNLSLACEKYLEANNINKQLFKMCHGTELQQKLHNEFVNIVHTSENLHNEIGINNKNALTTHAIHFAEVGCGYNHHNQLQKSITLANTCWALLDCTIGIAQGAGKGLQNISNFIIHPIDSTINIAKGIDLIARGIYRTLEMAHLIAAIKENRDLTGNYALRLNDIQEELNAISTTLEKQISELTIQDFARETTAFVTEAWLSGKLFSTIGKFVNSTKEGIQIVRDAAKAPKLVAATSEGVSVEASFVEKVGEELFSVMEKGRSGFESTQNSLRKIAQNLTESGAYKIWNESADFKNFNNQIKKLELTTQNQKIKPLQNAQMTCEELLKLDQKAESMYETIRKLENDIIEISKNTGLPKPIIEKIKNHIFFEEHVLENGLRKRFPADIDMASAWSRLSNGSYVQSDLRLLQHEFAEALLMKGDQVPWRVAHDITNKSFDWNSLLMR